MKKIYKIIVLVVILFSAVIYVWISRPTGTTLILDPNKDLAEQIEKNPFLMEILCPLPDEEGYNICCVRENKLVSCNNKELYCGEFIYITPNLSFDHTKYYVCEYKDMLPGDEYMRKVVHDGKILICLKERPSNSGYINYATEVPPSLKQGKYDLVRLVRLPEKEGRLVLLELYLVPNDLYPLSFDELVSSLEKFEKLIGIYGEIKCH